MNKQMNTVSIIIPCYQEETHIGKILEWLANVRISDTEIEVLIIDGMSTDRTREIVTSYCVIDSKFRLIDNPKRVQAPGLNLGIAAAQGRVIIRLDAHASYDVGYIRQCLDDLATTGADCVGGAQRILADTPFRMAFSKALNSYLGTGGARYRDATRDGFVDTVWLGAYRREVFEKIGGYDENARTNEDAELNTRLVKAGGKIYLSSKLKAYYYPRNSFRALFKQYYLYGQGRMRTLFNTGTLVVRPFAPLIFYMLLLTALITALCFEQFLYFIIPLTIYLLAVGSVAFKSALRSNLAGGLRVGAIIATIHFAHAAGAFCALFNGTILHKPLIPRFNPKMENPSSTSDDSSR